jgi:hypothetical protein
MAVAFFVTTLVLISFFDSDCFLWTNCDARLAPDALIRIDCLGDFLAIYIDQSQYLGGTSIDTIAARLTSLNIDGNLVHAFPPLFLDVGWICLEGLTGPVSLTR